MQIAKSSYRLTEDSRRDNKLNLEIAKNSARIAEESRRDSSSMKTIAALTLIFLPGTSIAVHSIPCPIIVEEFLLIESVVLLQHDDIQLASWAWRAHCIRIPMGLLRGYRTINRDHLKSVALVVSQEPEKTSGSCGRD